MKTKFYFLIALVLVVLQTKAQVIYKETFNGLQLVTAPSQPTIAQSSFTDVPSAYQLINDGFKNNSGTSLNYNKPFNNASLKTTGWTCVFNALENDTFLVSTSWLDSVATCNRWVITPPITITNDTSVFTWNAKSPDASYLEGYEVYLTTSTSTALTVNDFTPANQLFSITDNNTVGGGESSTWIKRAVSLNGRAGQTVRFAFRNTSRDRYQLWIDDIEVARLQRASDVALQQANYAKYVLANTSQFVSLTISPIGSRPITTVSVSYKVGTGLSQTEVFTFNPPLTYGQTKTISFGSPYSIATSGLYTFKTWINTVNGIVDENQNNDSLSGTISVQSTKPNKVCLVEQFTSAHNGACSQAQTDLLSVANASVITINIHNADSMQNNNASGLVTAYKKQFATAMIDRVYWNDKSEVALLKSQWAAKITERVNAVSPAAVSITNKNYNPTTRVLSFTVKADFVAEVKGDYRFNALLVENNVYGSIIDTTINGYNQWNNFYFTPWSAYYQLGYFSSIANTHVLNSYIFKHQRVLNRSLDGPFGFAGSIPTNGGTANQSYTKTYTITLPQATNNSYRWNADNIYIVGTLAEYNFDKNSRTILNAAQEKVTSGNEVISVKEETASAIKWWCAPNPANDAVMIVSENPNAQKTVLEIIDILGKVVLKQAIAEDRQIISVAHLKSGTYLIRYTQGEATAYRKLMVVH